MDGASIASLVGDCHNLSHFSTIFFITFLTYGYQEGFGDVGWYDRLTNQPTPPLVADVVDCCGRIRI